MAEFTIKTTEAIVDDIIVTIVTEVPEITDINPGSVLRTQVEAVSTELNLIYQALNTVYLGTRITTATGTDLENLGALVGVTRKAGTVSTGNVTFQRTSVATSDFTIAAGAIVSTQPNTGDDQLRFTVNANTTFSATITGETHDYKDGVLDYPLNERFVGSITSVTGTSGGSPTTFANGSDYTLVEDATIFREDTSTLVTLDTMETPLTDGGWFGGQVTIDSLDATTGWVAGSEGGIALNTTPGENKEGTGCLNLTKTAGVQTIVLYDKTQGVSFNFTSLTVFAWYYVDDKNDLAVSGAVQLRFGNDNANYYYKTYDRADLSNGWNLLSFDSANATGQTGTPTLSGCDYTGLSVTYDTASVTKTGNEQRFDFWRLAYVPIIDSVDYRQGTGSLRFTKLTTTSTNISYEKVETGATDSLQRDLVFWIKVLNSTVLSKISSIEVTFGSGGDDDNSYTETWLQSELTTGWQTLVFEPGANSVITAGVPNPAAINYVRIKIVTANAADTVTSGDLLIDYLHFADTAQYTGDLIRWVTGGTLPDDSTSWSITYKPLSKEVACTAEAVGASYNVSRNKIIYKVSVIANIDTVNNYNALSGGTDLETDDDLRTRIQFASEATGNATVEAIRQAVLAVNGVVAVTVSDLPLKNQLNEPHTYNTLTDEYTLDNEIALDNVNLVVTGTAGGSPYTFVNGTDYVLFESKVRFQIGGTNPDNATVFLVDYDYNWLGHVELFVTGSTTPLPVSVSDAIDDAIAEVKAAGVDVTWSEPSVVSVNVIALVSPDTVNGFTFGGIQNSVEDAITTYLNSRGPGDDVYLAQLYQAIQNVEGVLNSSITTPSGDVTIADNQVAKAGTITVGSL